MSFPEIKRFVSSAKKIVDRSLVQLARSLMYIRKSKGPRTDPCGTPHVIGITADLTWLYLTICLLFVR